MRKSNRGCEFVHSTLCAYMELSYMKLLCTNMFVKNVKKTPISCTACKILILLTHQLFINLMEKLYQNLCKQYFKNM
jgi:hypothetical protein